MRRRDFIKKTATGLVLPTIAGGIGFKSLGLTNLAAALSMADETDRALILIYLSGGNDGLNTLIPLDQMSALNKVRPHVVLPESGLLHLNNTDNALHPAYAGMKELYDEGRLSIVQNVGYPNPDYSHFRATDIWMSGSDSDVVINSGWTGRYLEYEYPGYPTNYPNEETPHPLAIEIGWNSSMLFQGAANNMGMVINDPTFFYELIDETVPDAPDTQAGERLEYVRLVAKQSQAYGEVVKTAAENINTQGAYPADNNLAEQLKICARLIAGGLKTKLFMVEIGGFDLHDSQVEGSNHLMGNHNYLLTQVSQAVKAFMDDCDGLGIGDRVMGMTFSEFGRRVVSNASNGTDHGTTAPLFVFGNNTTGGIWGTNPIIPNDAQYWYNMDMEFDYRQIYASLFCQWLCVPEEDVKNLLFKDFEQLPLVKNTPCAPVSTKPIASKPLTELKLFPNPVMDYAQVEFTSYGEPVTISVFDATGKKIMEPISSVFPTGTQVTGFSVKSLPAGSYIVRYSSGSYAYSKQLVKIK